MTIRPLLVLLVLSPWLTGCPMAMGQNPPECDPCVCPPPPTCPPDGYSLVPLPHEGEDDPVARAMEALERAQQAVEE